MLFNSLHFLLFFPVVASLHFAVPHRYRWAVLLGASYYFYASWRIDYLALLIFSTTVDYWAALRIEESAGALRRRTYLIASLSSNLGLLFYFKYLGFASEVAGLVLSPFGTVLGSVPESPLLPIGISFYTFQTISYTIDVYRRRIPAERHFGRFALYVSFFPQLVAGPIERAGRLIPQFARVKRFDRSRALSGLTLAAWGFFQKLVIADRLDIYVDAVFDHPQGQSAGKVLLGSYLFAFQLYADFAGYTDIAIGTARVLGFDLSRNFRGPYFATSVADFWSRWHISLTAWFRDYLYAAVRGDQKARRGKWRWARNMMIVFLATGLWHGAAWTFVVSGALHGLYMASAPALAPVRNRLWIGVERLAAQIGCSGMVAPVRPWVARFVTFHLVTLAFLFMRANSVADAILLLKSLGSGLGEFLPPLSIGVFEHALSIAALLVLLGVHNLERRGHLDVWLQHQPRWARWGTLYALACSSLMFGQFGATAFYYFQF